MKQSLFILERTRQLTPDIWELRLAGDTSALTTPGQFVNIALPGYFLRRPISVCDWDHTGLVLLVREAGKGTEELIRRSTGSTLDVLTGLGNGFDLSDSGDCPILAGGGVGIAPLYALARELSRRGIGYAVALGFRSKSDALYVEEFAALGTPVAVSTEDGTLGIRGTVVDLLRGEPERDEVFCCGPLPMLRAVWGLPHIRRGQFSLEARMGCGFGACMGCSVPTVHGMRRVCREGPVFRREELVWAE